MPAIYFVVGLGNPGSQYEGTRHNVGFDVVTLLATRLRAGFVAGKGDYLEARGVYGENEIRLVKPLTYMNNSGWVLLDLRERHNVPLDRLLVVCDDIHLPLGTLRLRKKGSDGGHNGLYSIIYHLQSDSFPRLRCGIGSTATPRDKSSMSRFVLEPFGVDEHPLATAMISRAADACLAVVAEGIDRAMNRFNTSTTT